MRSISSPAEGARPGSSTIAATSSGSMSRFTAFRSSSRSSTTCSGRNPLSLAWSPICFSTSGVRTNHGQTAVTVTSGHRAAASRAAVLVRPRRPCLAVTYAALFRDATRPCTEATLMIRPQPLRYMPGMRRCISTNGAVSLTASKT
jgi:hypothetical protein